MSTSKTHHARIANLTFASVYPHFVIKIEKKDRTKAELHQVITGLTGFDEKTLHQLIAENVTYDLSSRLISS